MAELKPRQRKFAPRSRTGCLTCRTRRKRCEPDSARPDCSNCKRLNLTCEWQAQRKVVVVGQSSESSSPSPESQAPGQLQPSIDPWDALPGDATSERKHLLQYYVEAFVPSVSVATTPTSFYTSLYMPWAFQSEGMLDAILAITSAQLARRSMDQNRAQNLRAVSTRHERKCYAFIQNRVSQTGVPIADTYQVAAVILILVGLEALNGVKTTRWMSQIQCVQRILNTLTPEQHLVDCWEVDSLRRHFTYHFVSASLMARVSGSPSFSSSAEQELSPLLSPTTMPLTVDPLMGISYQLCNLTSRIQYLSSSNPTYLASFNAIEQGILNWTYESPFTLGIDLTIALDLVALAEAYRLAAFIQLYRTSPTHAALIPTCASRAMEFIVRIPTGSPAESSLLYPIFLVGAELEDDTARETCSKRLEDIQKRNRYENVAAAQKVLKEVWRPTLKGGKKRNWEDVLRELKWSFTLG
ncbi:hypothetical protein P153DRAFT_378347 [Dothidotthia symphoricarpi CBS 119687]|uniref:Zn(2)-C6 fungal-type domain-containing protein n=1 Tax=Dothidotthia symphoricarpi CBS 119687 TaxID=1392245 RepID=A0A6A6A685_9PLEO|nr:uncharacterized protein P153DRAFT_378347 [Dothidotthia symphoricarpi CBS 119687]KAF2126131.1 hypothetical protein P153DRAFT_378347 [Dothidotthia symphoricarpi CBS 119687]